MQLALRPYVTTGIALVGASVIAMSPISPVTPDIHVPTINTSSVAVQLTGAINPTGDPFSAWLNTAVNAVEGAVGIGGQVLGNGAPVLTQVLANQMGYLNQINTAINKVITNLANWQSNTQWYRDYAGVLFAEGKIGEAFNWGVIYPTVAGISAFFPAVDLMSLPGQILQNITNVAQAIPLAVMMLGNAVIDMLAAPLFGFSAQLQAIVDSVKAGDPLGVVNAVLNIPAVMTNAFLSSAVRPYRNWLDTGLIGALVMGIPNMIADAIKPPASPLARVAVESAPDTLVADASSIAVSTLGGPETLTVSLDSKAETPATETPAEETPAAETPVDETPATETPVDETPVNTEPVAEAEAETEPTKPATLVRDSAQAKPGQLGVTKASEAGASLAKPAHGDIAKVVSKIDEGIKKAFGQPTKTAATQSASSDSSDTGSNE